MRRHMEDGDQVSCHCGNTIQGQAWWECQRDHLLGHGSMLGTDQRWAEVLAFQMACQLSLGPWR